VGSLLRFCCRLNTNFSTIGAQVEKLRVRLAHVESEIAADADGLEAYGKRLQRIRLEQEVLRLRLKKNREWAAQFSTNVGPFEQKYDALTAEIGVLYDAAKEKHAKGLQVLMDEFHYHPAFKRAGDNFSAVPFRPA
jgi:chromosome segregation ATPase